MRVETENPFLTQQSRVLQQDHQVQDLFSQILESVGRQGYASAEPVGEEPITSDQITESWGTWFDVHRSGQYSSADQPDSLRQAYGEVLVGAYSDGGYVDPKTFLKGLSKEQLKTVQEVNALADPINVDNLTEEGALNLLLPRAAQVDINRDGFTQSGRGYGFRFPDSTTPPDVVQAWEETTAGMSWGERAMHELQMKMPLISANFFVDANGAYSHHYEPGDPEFTNPMTKPGYSYQKVAQGWLDHYEYLKNETPPEQYAQQTDFWSRFKSALIEQGAD